MAGTTQAVQGRHRSRASIACSTCRVRRSRCMRREGESSCQYCKTTGIECMIEDNDGRRRQVSKVEVSALRQRLALLEETLIKQKPSAAESRRQLEALSREPEKDENDSTCRKLPTPAMIPSQECLPDALLGETSHCRILSADNVLTRSKSPERCSPASSQHLVNTVINARGHWIHDGDIGQRCYFQPNSNTILHYTNMVKNSSVAAFQSECIQAIQSIPLATQHRLADVYWKQSNSLLPVIDKELFNEDKCNNGTSHYSPFLYLCILATGLAYSDKSPPDIKALSPDDSSETTLMRELHRLSAHVVDRPAGIPSIQALLLLGRLECMNGRQNAGWLYSSLACRLAFDFGLHLDVDGAQLSEAEVQTRALVLWACVVSDRFWTLHSGREPKIPLNHISASIPSASDLRIGSLSRLECQIYGSLVSLLVIGSKMMPIGRAGVSGGTLALDYANLITLEQELENWYSTLSDAIKWKPANINTTPMSFFHLHLQYHTTLVLLYRPFAEFDSLATNSPASPRTSAKLHCITYSQRRCLEEAIFISRILNKSRAGSIGSRTFVTNIEHASIAGSALVASLLSIGDSKERIKPLKHLYSLIGTLQTMSHTQTNAKNVAMVLQSVINDHGWDVLLEDDDDDFDLSSLYAQCRGRRATSDHYEIAQTKKRKVTSSETWTAQRICVPEQSASSERLTDGPSNMVAPLEKLLQPVDSRIISSAGAIGTEVVPTDATNSTTQQQDIVFNLPIQWNQEPDGRSLGVGTSPGEFPTHESFLWNFAYESQFDKYTATSDLLPDNPVTHSTGIV